MDELNDKIVSIRADTSAFARDVAVMRAELEGPFAAGADRAGRAIETSLLRAIRTGKIGFDDLKSVALSVLAEIAASAIRSGIGAILGGGGQAPGPGGLLSQVGGILGGVLGLPGRATGGPVGPGHAYVVGERGPELFVPTSSGSIATGGNMAAREVRVALTINAPAGTAPEMLARSSRQVARAVRSALVAVE
ncbi:tail tape measure protein [Sphingomonas sp. SUN039]|uniref:tail tape measure protein n=1 Tax=Sphingomonas sp. SUN039 TaxID=2937787 RepID=UPI00216415C9|nr:tail tape measure protein [Sphingomonas sp. SUN039]UVO52973.1 tail tape measure protein [Sphingomonas sp. SUN039]